MIRTTRFWTNFTIFAVALGGAAGLALLQTPRTQPSKLAPQIATPVQGVERAPQTVAAPAYRPLHPAAAQQGPFMPPVPRFVESGPDTFEALSTRYTAQISAEDGLRYTINANATGAPSDGGELRLNLQRVQFGALTLFERESDVPDTDAPVRKGEAGVCFYRGASVQEIYEPRGDGIEQTFVVDAASGGSGALEFECAFDTRELTPLPPRAGRTGGILFRDRHGDTPLRYGRIVVRDAAFQAVALDPHLNAEGTAICFEVPAQFTALAQFPLTIDPLVGSDFSISPNEVNATNQPIVFQPTVAAGTSNFLVAWADTSAGTGAATMAATIVGLNGMTSPAYVISNQSATSQNPAGAQPQPYHFQRIEAAFDGLNWLVVWSDLRAQAPGIYGAIVSSTGVVSGGSDFIISSTSGTGLELPLVSFDGSNYTVAWMDRPPSGTGSSQIFFTRVAPSKVISPIQALKSNLASANQSLEYLAAQAGGETLLLYDDVGENPQTHRSVRIPNNPSSPVLDPGGTVLFNDGQAATPPGFGRPIGATFVNGNWNILSSFDQTNSSDIFLTLLNPTTGGVTPPNGVFAHMGLGPTNLVDPINLQHIDSFGPAFPGSSEWLFVRNEKVSATVYHQIGKRVLFDGTDLDPVPFQIDTANKGGLLDGVAAQSGGSFLVAWTDGRRAAAQPSFGQNIDGALVDAALPGNGGVPLVAVATASPTFGSAPLTVNFDASQSTGLTGGETYGWDFGDNSSVSTARSPAHVYKHNGTYIATLTIVQGSYAVFENAVITVGSGGSGQIGTPLFTTPPIVPGLIISNCVISLDFSGNLNNDKVTLAGKFDTSSFTDGLQGLQPTVQVGPLTFTLPVLDATGTSATPPLSSPVTTLVFNQKKNTFAFTLTAGNLRNELVALGLINDSVSPPIDVTVPITIGVAKVMQTFSVDAKYHAAKNATGVANFSFGALGKPISGAFTINAFSASELPGGLHSFTIAGQLLKPGAFSFALGLDNNVYLGDYTAPFSGGAVFGSTTLSYIQTHQKSGLKKFAITPATGGFVLQFLRVPAAASAGGTGLPLASDPGAITNVDLNLSFLFNLKDGTTLSAGQYMHIYRTVSTSRAWKLR